MWALASLYFEQVWGYGATGRGFVQLCIGVGWTLGVWLGGEVTQRRLADGRLDVLATVCGNAFLLFFVGGIALAVAPDDRIALVAVTVLAVGNGVWQPPYFSAVGRIAPPGLSGRAYASSVLVYAFGGFGFLGVGAIADATGQRVGFVCVGLAGLAAALLARSAGPLIVADLQRADRRAQPQPEDDQP
jgi:predicted MFS family arabinose efflux permease